MHLDECFLRYGVHLCRIEESVGSILDTQSFQMAAVEKHELVKVIRMVLKLLHQSPRNHILKAGVIKTQSRKTRSIMEEMSAQLCALTFVPCKVGDKGTPLDKEHRKTHMSSTHSPKSSQCLLDLKRKSESTKVQSSESPL